MPGRITPGQIRENNRRQIYNYIYNQRKASQQDMQFALRLSRPTVAANLTELEQDGLVCRSGQIETDQIGRKAIAYAVVPDFRIAVGVEVLRREAKLIAIDLYGKKIQHQSMALHYSNDPDYYKSLCEGVNAFIDALPQPNDRVLGIAISMQGLASPDGRTLVFGRILDCTEVKIDAFEQWLPYPCRFMHDPKGAALSELWVSPELTDAVYLSLSRHLGGALISGGRVLPGRHGHNAVFEHIQADPNGEPCYCGKRGCWDTLCSMLTLMGDQDPDSFFAAARRPETPEARRWERYLHDLARLINLIHLTVDEDIILGGHLAPYFNAADLALLYADIHSLCPFDEPDDFLHMSKMPAHNIAVGICLPYIRDFLEDISN